jgi:hypothetical protein
MSIGSNETDNRPTSSHKSGVVSKHKGQSEYIAWGCYDQRDALR